jgi:hypothetical protein
MPENIIAVYGIQQTAHHNGNYKGPFDILIGHTNNVMF